MDAHGLLMLFTQSKILHMALTFAGSNMSVESVCGGGWRDCLNDESI